MTSYVLQDNVSKKYLEKTDAWGHTLTDDLQRARIYVNASAAKRTANNIPRYFKGNMPEFQLMEIKIVLAEKDYIRAMTESGDFYKATKELWDEYRAAVSRNDWNFAQGLEEGRNPDFFYDP